MFRALLLVLAIGGATLSGAHALDGSETPATERVFSNPQQALREGLAGYRAGNVSFSVEALKYAAAGGQSLAQWKLAKMYADGDGVPRDDAKAYDYYGQIVQSYDEDSPNRREISIVSAAYVAVGVYSLTGIATRHLEPDTDRALEMFQYAATAFGDPNAQYNLARMYLDGAGVEKDIRQAARWLNLAADKNHYQSQALLGHLLFAGQGGVPKQRARGLMWLTLARAGIVDAKKDAWVVDLYDRALKGSTDEDRQMAAAFVQEREKRRN